MKPFLLSVFLIFGFVNQSQGQSWLPLNNGVRKHLQFPIVYGLGHDNTHSYLYLGGNFDSAGSFLCRKLAIWNGTDWLNVEDSLGGHYTSDITAMTNWGDTVIFAVGHSVISVYGLEFGVTGPFNNISGGDIKCLYVFHDTLYAGGYFTGRIKKWDGSVWKTVGGGISGISANVRSINEYNGELVIGGYFQYAGDSLAHSIARFDGSVWHPMKEGVRNSLDFYSGHVMTLAAYNDDLIVGGLFDSAGSIIASNIASWNGSDWENPFGDGFDANPNCMYVDSSGLYIGGTMNYVNGTDMNYITRWDGINFYPMSNGFNNSVMVVDRFNGNLYAGGIFNETQDGETLNSISMYDIGTLAQNSFEDTNDIEVFPNPTSTTITLLLPSYQNTILSIFNLLGEKVKEEKVTGKQVTMDVSLLPQGLYLVRMQNRVVGKFVKE